MLAFASALAGLVACEFALRIVAERSSKAQGLAGAIASAGALLPGQTGRWVHVLRMHPSEDLVYELAPDFHGAIQMGTQTVEVDTNRHGFRSADVEPNDAEDCWRLLGIGDSVMFGWGLAQTESYMTLLADALERQAGERCVEVINTAVGGYNTGQEVETLELKGIQFEPDVVLLGLVENDLDKILYERQPERALLARKSMLLERMLGARSSASKENDESALEDGWLRFESALDRLQALQHQHGFQVLAFTFRQGYRSDRMLKEAEARGMRVASLGGKILKYARSHGIAAEELVLSGDAVGHPSAIQCRLIARFLLEELEAQGLFQP